MHRTERFASCHDFDKGRKKRFVTKHFLSYQIWEEERTGQPCDVDVLKAACEKERKMLRDLGLSTSEESETREKYFLDCQFTVRFEEGRW